MRNVEQYRTLMNETVEQHMREGLRRAYEGLQAMPEEFRKPVKQSIIRTRITAQSALGRMRSVYVWINLTEPSEAAEVEEEVVEIMNAFASLYRQDFTPNEPQTPLEEDGLQANLRSALEDL